MEFKAIEDKTLTIEFVEISHIVFTNLSQTCYNVICLIL